MINIRETTIIPKGCSEQFLPLDQPAGKGLGSQGMILAGISELARGYRIGRPDPAFHLVLLTCHGSGLFESNTGTRILSEKEILVAPAHCAYRYRPVQTPWTIIWFHIVPGMQWRMLDLPEPSIERGTRAHRLEHIARALWGEAIWDPAPDSSLADGLSRTLFQMLRRELAYLEGGPKQAHSAGLARVFELVDSQLDRAWTVPGMAREAALSASYFSALTRRIHGVPPMHLVTRFRMQRAATLLEHTVMPAYAIGPQIGYDDPFAFSVAFKRYHGVSPRAYRRMRSPRDDQRSGRNAATGNAIDNVESPGRLTKTSGSMWGASTGRSRQRPGPI